MGGWCGFWAAMGGRGEVIIEHKYPFHPRSAPGARPPPFHPISLQSPTTPQHNFPYHPLRAITQNIEAKPLELSFSRGLPQRHKMSSEGRQTRFPFSYVL